MGSQKLELQEIKVRVRLGCSEEERAFPQIVLVTVRLDLPVTKSSLTDDLGDTVDYRSILEIIEAEAGASEWKLLEKLTFDLCSRCLEAFPIAEGVTFSARKQNIFTSALGPTVTTSIQRGDLP